jgi:hypothetical protein
MSSYLCNITLDVRPAKFFFSIFTRAEPVLCSSLQKAAESAAASLWRDLFPLCGRAVTRRAEEVLRLGKRKRQLCLLIKTEGKGWSLRLRVGRAKDGEGLARAGEPIIGDLIDWTSHESAHQSAGEDAGWRGAGAESVIQK